MSDNTTQKAAPAARSGPSAPSAELRAKVLAAISREPAPTRADVTKRAMMIALVGIAAVLAMFFAAGGVMIGTRTPTFIVEVTLAWAAIATILTWVSLRRGSLGLGLPTAVLGACAVAAAPLLCVLYMLLHGADGASVTEFPLRVHVTCFAMTAAFAVAPFAVVAALRRGADPVHPRALSALSAATSAAWGGAVVTLHCPIGADAHVLLGHVLPSLVLALIGAAIGVRVFGLRRSAA